MYGGIGEAVDIFIKVGVVAVFATIILTVLLVISLLSRPSRSDFELEAVKSGHAEYEIITDSKYEVHRKFKWKECDTCKEAK